MKGIIQRLTIWAMTSWFYIKDRYYFIYSILMACFLVCRGNLFKYDPTVSFWNFCAVGNYAGMTYSWICAATDIATVIVTYSLSLSSILSIRYGGCVRTTTWIATKGQLCDRIIRRNCLKQLVYPKKTHRYISYNKEVYSLLSHRGLCLL